MRRVVVTGAGVVSPIGMNLEDFRASLLAGRGAIGPIQSFDASEFVCQVAAEIHGYDPKAHFSAAELTLMDRFAQFALLSAREAMTHSGLVIDDELAERASVIHGTGIGGQITQDEAYEKIIVQGGKRLHPFTVPKLMTNSGTSQISMAFGIKGPSFTTSTACSSAGHAICLAYMLIRQGMVDAALTGGAEACLTSGTIRSWEGLRVMARDTCRPFSHRRGGMVMGEGAGTLVLETLEHAQARGANILAEVIGMGMSADAGNIVQPDKDGAARALRWALQDGGLAPEDVQYINAHGTGTPQNDPTETAAIRDIFGMHADELAVSSTKSMHGHALGAAAALESIATLVALQEQVAPPTINFEAPDPECDLDYVPNEPRPMAIDVALTNSFAFGGLNTVVAFKRFAG